MPVFVLDNGAYEIKAGYATDEEPVRMVNAITRSSDRRSYIGNQVYSCKDYHGLAYRRPHEKGHLVNWEAEKAIWDHLFYGTESGLSQSVDPSDTSLILTEMPYTLPALSSHMDQIVFEEYGFDSYYRCPAGSLVPWNDIHGELFGASRIQEGDDSETPPVAECSLVVDAGFSGVNVMPVMLGEVYYPGVKRMSIGGKLLTNYLRETVSFRHYNMMADTYLINLIKEATSYVSLDFAKDLAASRSGPKKKDYVAKYVLPDFKTTRTGYLLQEGDVKDDSQVLALANERFTIPELLFHPSDIGLEQSGLPETIMHSINTMPEEVRPMLTANIVVVGGCAKLPNLRDRLAKELEPLVPQGATIRIGIPDDPISYAWKGGKRLGSRQDLLSKVHVTKAEYLEHGLSRCSRFGPTMK